MNRILLPFVFITLTACENFLIKEEPPNNQLNNFEIFWNDFDQHYSGFIVRDINWDSVRQASIAKIETGLSEKEFFEMMKNITLYFKDGHVGLKTSYERVFYDSSNPNSINFIQSFSAYIENFKHVNEAISYGTIKSENIGYIKISTFTPTLSLSDFEVIDKVLSNLSTTEGIIVDLRSNSGGEFAHHHAVLSRFIDKQLVSMKLQSRNGPNHDDFGPYIEGVISPQGPYQYVNPVVILTNRRTASASELFTMALKDLENITVIGDTTAGSIGYFIGRELPNGWVYSITTALTSDRNGISYEGMGIPPDEVVWISKADSINGIDTQLEKAIDWLEE
ncbi:S41 family peptidase [Xanthovirga aplysinae]|uniref:S41 family peptidase n=1 Tax=Xanthovirga aplysinae TaxID=2529853 RepID=UPI001656F27D|nr:S41 family peptidase [Xanthovirga aplysinae]